jgi:hypothetical protein
MTKRNQTAIASQMRTPPTIGNVSGVLVGCWVVWCVFASAVCVY